MRELIARQEVEQLAARLKWQLSSPPQPPQEWFDEDVNPFELAGPVKNPAETSDDQPPAVK